MPRIQCGKSHNFWPSKAAVRPNWGLSSKSRVFRNRTSWEPDSTLTPIEDISGHPEDFYRAHYTLAKVNEQPCDVPLLIQASVRGGYKGTNQKYNYMQKTLLPNIRENSAFHPSTGQITGEFFSINSPQRAISPANSSLVSSSQGESSDPFNMLFACNRPSSTGSQVET